MTQSSNYNPIGLPNNTIDVRLTTTASSNLTITTSTLTMESLNVSNGRSYNIANATATASNSTLTLGNSSGFTNVFSGVANDLVYVTGNSILTVQGPSPSGGSGVLNLNLASSGNFNVNTGSSLTISSVISGVGISVTKTGSGGTVLSGSNTYSGTTTLAGSGGTLNAAATGALGSTSGVTVNSSGTLLLSGSGNLNRVKDFGWNHTKWRNTRTKRNCQRRCRCDSSKWQSDRRLECHRVERAHIEQHFKSRLRRRWRRHTCLRQFHSEWQLVKHSALHQQQRESKREHVRSGWNGRPAHFQSG